MGEGDVVDSLYLSKSFETLLTSMYILIIILSESRSVVSNSCNPHGPPARLPCPWGTPGKSTRVGCHFLHQGIFPTQESNPGLPHCRRILYQLSHKGSPRILEWVAYDLPDPGIELGSHELKADSFLKID